MKILITGGAGFIGCRLARQLAHRGDQIVVLDNLNAQVHGPDAAPPQELTEIADVRIGSVQNADLVRNALAEVDAIVHLAAETGPAQSMYEITRYGHSNLTGTSVLLQEMLPARDRIKSFVVASSRAVYGEGKYECERCGIVYPDARDPERLSRGQWEPACPTCGTNVRCLATDENSLPKPTSIYAVHKLAQEQMCLTMGRAYGIPTQALRYQNVYGPGQSMTNPYIGVLAIFAARIKSGSPIQVYEDGKESRDFVHVDDVVHATVLALDHQSAGSKVYNVGSGSPTSLHDVALTLTSAMGGASDVSVTGRYRVGDIRHCFADLTQATCDLGYRPAVSLADGLRDLAAWAWAEDKFSDQLDTATRELTAAGLYR